MTSNEEMAEKLAEKFYGLIEGDVSVSGSTAAVMATASGTTSGSTITFDTLPAGATVTVPAVRVAAAVRMVVTPTSGCPATVDPGPPRSAST